MTTFNIDLANWNVTKDVDSKGGKTGEAVEVAAHGNVQLNADGSITFVAHVDGATTSGSKYPRDELRETTAGKLAAWKLSTGGVMTAGLTVDKLPTKNDNTLGKVVIGQIHGKDNELVRLYCDAGRIYFHNDLSGDASKPTENEFKLLNVAGLEPHVSPGDKLSYKISAHESTLNVDVSTPSGTYASSTTILPVWQSDELYFKAGVYLGNNSSQGATGLGQTTFFALSVSHEPPVVVVPSPPAPVPPPPVVTPPAATPTKIAGLLRQIADLVEAG